MIRCLILICCLFASLGYCGVPPHTGHSQNHYLAMDNEALLTNQINGLKTRLLRSETDLLRESQKQTLVVNKTLLEKEALNISILKSSLESIAIEFADAEQNINWLEKSIQEIQNQLNVLNMFGLKSASQENININHYQHDVIHQKKLLSLEKERLTYLEKLSDNIQLLLKKEQNHYASLTTLYETLQLSELKKQGTLEELDYQDVQNQWLTRVNVLSNEFGNLDLNAHTDKSIQLERDIFYANEKANFAYIRSLIARYKNQIQEMHYRMNKESSINLLNEIRGQIQLSTKQINRLKILLKERSSVVQSHLMGITNQADKKTGASEYIENLKTLSQDYEKTNLDLNQLAQNLQDLQLNLDNALQKELSIRQGFISFGKKSIIELGKEVLLVPALTFEMFKSFSTHLVSGFKNLTVSFWLLFLLGESIFLTTVFLLRKLLLSLNNSLTPQFNLQWLSLQCVHRNFYDLFIVGNIIAVMLFLDVSLQHFSAVILLGLVWVMFKTLLTISRISLIETTHDTTGHDVRLYHRLKWMIIVGGIITAFTVFLHQLPFIIVLKNLCDQFFLLLLMIVSLLLLRSWDVVSNLILSHMESKHPYLQKSISLIGLLIPILIFGNALLGLLGYVNLIITISRYEGIFILVLFAYLILRGILNDGMEYVSRLLIQYVNNGWLLTEAFLKPLDKVLRLTLFLFAWAILFLLYGWDEKSPIVERLTRLLHYNLAHVLNTTITPLSIIELLGVISIFYWTAKWTREFVYRLLLSRTQDMGIRNSIALLTQYSVIIIGGLICLRVLGIDLGALAVVFSVFAFGIGWGLRDLANNFVCGFLILLERPLRVGDIVCVSDIEGEVINIGSRAVTVRTWDHMDLVVPNTEIFNKSFTNWTAKDNIVRSVLHIKISRYDNPHEVKLMIQSVLNGHKDVLKDPQSEVYLKEMTDNHMDFELRYYVNIRQVTSRTSVVSTVLMEIWDVFAKHEIKPPHPQQEIFISNERPKIEFHELQVKHQPNSG